MKLKDKVTVIVGGEGPLGREVSKKFLSEGAKLLIGWYSPAEWSDAKESLADFKGKFIDMQVDATKEEQVQALMDKAVEKFSSIDCLLHMVGMIRIGPKIWETDTAVWDSLLSANLKSAFLCSKYAIRVMLTKNWGRIVFFPARVAQEPKPGFGSYAVSKAGLLTLINVLRTELKDTNITVNGVMPDVMETFRTRQMHGADTDKMVKTGEVADALIGLCSDEMSSVSGTVLKLFGKM